MKGIVLSGDSGSRLYPLTLGIPKQFLPIYNRPMVYYPIETLVKAGVTDILLVTTREHQSAFVKYLGDGQELGCRISYAIQDEPKGIAEALMIGKPFIGKDAVCLITGDTLFLGNISSCLAKAIRAVKKSGNATIFVSREMDPGQYGKLMTGHTIVGDSEERYFKSITGLYVFPKGVAQKIRNVQPSERGLLEITSVSLLYQAEEKLQIQELPSDCQWLDTNSFDNLLKCNVIMQKQSKQL